MPRVILPVTPVPPLKGCRSHLLYPLLSENFPLVLLFTAHHVLQTQVGLKGRVLSAQRSQDVEAYIGP